LQNKAPERITQRLFMNYNQICQLQGNRKYIVW